MILTVVITAEDIVLNVILLMLIDMCVLIATIYEQMMQQMQSELITVRPDRSNMRNDSEMMSCSLFKRKISFLYIFMNVANNLFSLGRRLSAGGRPELL